MIKGILPKISPEIHLKIIDRIQSFSDEEVIEKFINDLKEKDFVLFSYFYEIRRAAQEQGEDFTGLVASVVLYWCLEEQLIENQSIPVVVEDDNIPPGTLLS